jgi:DNA-binding GntR family transcriptional regulator
MPKSPPSGGPTAVDDPATDGGEGAQGRRSAREVASDLRRRIQAGQLKPGEWLREIRLAEELNAGRSAVREALRFLEQDGLVELERFRGARVTTPTLYEMFDLFEVRAALFGLVTRFACFRASDADLAEIIARIEHLISGAGHTTAEERVNEGVEIGAMISRHANRDAREMMNASHRKARWHFSYLELLDRSYRPLDDWRDMAEKMRVRDAEGAAAAARRIIYYVQQEVINSLAARGAAAG